MSDTMKKEDGAASAPEDSGGSETGERIALATGGDVQCRVEPLRGKESGRCPSILPPWLLRWKQLWFPGVTEHGGGETMFRWPGRLHVATSCNQINREQGSVQDRTPDAIGAPRDLEFDAWEPTHGHR